MSEEPETGLWSSLLSGLWSGLVNSVNLSLSCSEPTAGPESGAASALLGLIEAPGSGPEVPGPAGPFSPGGGSAGSGPCGLWWREDEESDLQQSLRPEDVSDGQSLTQILILILRPSLRLSAGPGTGPESPVGHRHTDTHTYTLTLTMFSGSNAHSNKTQTRVILANQSLPEGQLKRFSPCFSHTRTHM